jgi:D-amino peptidase
MRIVLSGDMEGISQITNPREVSAACPEYWATGRRRYNDDVAAVARGLLAGGATEVIVLDNHASGNPENLIQEALPEGARLETWNVFELPERGIAGMFQVGYHARAGINGFMSHTYSPRLKLRVDDELIGESHGRIWAAKSPLLGIVGTDAHEHSLGSLAGAPFLVVQQSSSRQETVPAFVDPEANANAIERFAEQCMRADQDAPRPAAPPNPTFQAKLDCIGEDRETLLNGGWKPTNTNEFVVELSDWSEARVPLYAAMAAANGPMDRLRAGLDLTSLEALQIQDSARIHQIVATFVEWARADEVEW